MKNFINIIKLVLFKKRYISELCEHYGNPQEVHDHLQLIANTHQVLSKFLKKDIEKLDKETEMEYQNYIENLNYAHEERGGCHDCPFGNGEGGCTIPGYCN